MATRSAVWQIAADFSRARRESDSTARSLKRLNRERENFVEDSLEGNDDLIESNKAHDKSVRARAAELGRLAREQRKQARETRTVQQIEESAIQTSDEVVSATRRQAGAHKSAEGTLRGLLKSRRAHVDAMRAEAAQTEAVVRAQGNLQKSMLSNERATLALEAAQRRLTSVQKQHGSSSQQYAAALLSVQRRQNDVATSAHRMAQAQATASGAMRQASSGGGGLVGTLGRVAGGFFSGAAASKAFGIALTGIKFGAIIYGAGALVSVLSNLSAGVLSLIGPLSSLGGVVAALPQAFSVAAGGIGTFLAAFSGVGEALKAGSEAAKVAGKEAKAVGKAERDSARQIKAAAQQVKAAQRQVKAARQSVADTARQNAQAIRAANQSIADSEKALADAHEGVSDARRQAREEIQSYSQALSDLALQERGASLSVEEARRRLNETLIDPGADSLAKAQSQLAYDEALARLDDVRKEQKNTQKEAADAKRKGVNGSDIVISALDNEREATKAVQEAQRNLAETRRSAAQAAVAAAQSVKDAQRGVKDAQQNLRDAHEATAEAVESAASAQTKYNDALEGLSPAAQKFVKTLLGMQDELKQLRDSAAAGLLPGVGAGLTTLLKLVPLLSVGLFRMGRVMGNAFKNFADLMTTGPFTRMFGNILNSNVRLMRMGGKALTNIAAALVYVMDAAAPFTEWLGETVLGWTKFGRESAKAGNKTGGIASALEKTRKVMQILGGTLKNLWGTFKNIGGAGNDLGMDLLRSFRRITKGWEEWTGSIGGQNELKEWFDSARPALHQLSKLGGAIMRMFFDLGKKNNVGPLIKQIRTELLPVIEDLLAAFQGDVAESMITALAKVGKLVAKLAENGGGLTVFFDTISNIADVINAIPAPVLQGLVTALATIAALRFAGAVTGVTALGKGIGKAARAANGVRQRRGEGRSGSTTTTLASTGLVDDPKKKGGARKKPKPSMGGRLRARMAQRNESGFVALGGSSPSGSRKKPKPEKKTFRERAKARFSRSSAPSAGDDTEKKAGRAGAAAKKMGGGLTKAAGGATALAAALSFIPGPIGEAAGKFLQFSMILTLLSPLLGLIKSALSSVGPFFSKLGSVVASVVGKVGKYLGKMVKIVGRAMMLIGRALMANPWMLLIAALVIVIVLIVRHWDRIKKIVMKAINAVLKFIKDHWDIIKYFLGPMVVLITLIAKHWDKIKAVFMRAVESLLSTFSRHWDIIKGIFSAVWDWVSDRARRWWDGLRDTFSRGADRLREVFSRLREGISNIWDRIKDAVSQPVEFVVNTVINDGIIKNYNKLADLLPGVGPIDEVHFGGFKKGGIPSARNTDVYPGYTPGKDIGFIGISGGEAIMRPEWTRAIGSKNIEEMNRTARTGGVGALRKKFAGNFARGGIPAVGSWSAHSHADYPWTTWSGDINVPGSGDYGNPVRAYKDGTVSLVKYLGDTSYGRYIKINHTDGSSTLYAHLSSAIVEGGQKVKRGQQIGRVGDLGNASGPHLHFEISNGSDPITMGSAFGPGSSSGGLDLPGWAKPMVNKTADWVRDKVNGGIDRLSSLFGDSPFVKMVAGVPKMLMDNIVQFISGKTALASPSDEDPYKFNLANAPTSNVSAVQEVAKKYGWGSGRQWDRLGDLIQRESSWNNNAQNPNSTAFGLFQFLDSTWAGVGGHKTSNPTLQAMYGLKYIKNRYGTPSNAVDFHNSHGWYSAGGVVPKAGVSEGAPTQMFARGGKVRGYGNRDTVPAMLTPGEFVLKKDTVERIGMDNLERMNRSRTKRGKAEGTQHFHRGGPVLGMREGAHGKWVKALEYMARQTIDGKWDKRLTNVLKGLKGPGGLRYPRERSPLAGGGSAGGPGRLRLGTYNLHHGTALDRNKDDLRKITGMVDTLSLQEMMFDKGDQVRSFLNDLGWGVYYPQTGMRDGRTDEAAIAWNNNRYEALQKGYKVLNSKNTGGYKKAVQRIAPYVLLQDRASGEKFWQVDAHTVVGGYRSKANRPEMMEQYGNLRKLYAQLRRSGHPVFMAGDMNNPNPLGDLKIPGLRRANPKGIDAILYGSGTRLVSSGKLGGQGFGGGKNNPGALGSDHPFLWAEFALGESDPKKVAKAANDPKKVAKAAKAVSRKKRGGKKKKRDADKKPTAASLLTANVEALHEKLGISKKQPLGEDTAKAVFHALAHTFGREHDDFSYRPWKAWTPLEASIIQAGQKNDKIQQWQSALEQISTWGYESLMSDLFSKGMDDTGAFNTAIEAAQRKRLAKVLNDRLALVGTFSDDDFQRLIRMIGFLQSQVAPPGLRDTARHLGLSDYETVSLYEKSNKAGRLNNVASVKRSRLEGDIRSWREGTFYFNSGGKVPGAGNRDTVPAMLTPGEFVIKKQAAEALGLRNLWALNNLQKFATGGLVMAPDVSRPPTRSTVGVSAHRLSAAAAGSVVNNVTFDVDIHNPIAERSTKSLTKALQRQSALKSSGGKGWQSVAGTSGN